METQSYRKNIRTNQARFDDEVSALSGTSYEPRDRDASALKRLRWLPRWISFSQKKKVVSLILLFVIAASGYGVYEKFFNLSDAERAQKELKAAISAISKHMILPENDEPVLATVTDAETLAKQQPFFAGALNGDQLLLFPKNMKAIIFSSSRSRIINVGPIEQQPQLETTGLQVNHASNGASQNANTQNALTVEIRNGTGKSGLASQVAGNIRAAGFTVVAVTDAKVKNYLKSIVVSRTKMDLLAPLEATLLTGLAAQIGAEFVKEIPNGEKSTDADVLIILGGE